MHEGIVSYELGVIGRPAVAEDLAVARDILLSEMTGGHIHIAHVSSKILWIWFVVQKQKVLM